MASATFEPYATVIVPTRDRVATLALAIGSIQAQTVPGIEIVISGDGVSGAARAEALRLAGMDPRIVFHDFPKAPHAGAENRDRAVRLARGPRIFYCDDDDLLLPHHVETLGPVLDRYDAADSAPAFVSRSGAVQIFLVNHARGPLREALAAGHGAGKLTADTHFAHRKEAYERLHGPWGADRTGRSATIGFFQGFAAQASIRWQTIPNVTALSFNGRVRKNVSVADRRAELQSWYRRIAHGARLFDDAFYDWYFFALAGSIGKAWPRTTASFLAPLGISINATQPDADVSYSIPGARLASLNDLFALMGGAALASSDIGRLATRLADPLFGWARPNFAAAALLKSALGTKRMLRVLRDVDAADAYTCEMAAFLECWLHLSNERSEHALSVVEKLINSGPIYRGAAHVQAALACRQMGDGARALDHARTAVSTDPTLKTGYQLAVELLVEQRAFNEAHRIAEQACRFLPDHIAGRLEQHAGAHESRDDGPASSLTLFDKR